MISINKALSKKQLVERIENLKAKLARAEFFKNTGLVDCYSEQIKFLETELKHETLDAVNHSGRSTFNPNNR